MMRAEKGRESGEGAALHSDLLSVGDVVHQWV